MGDFVLDHFGLACSDLCADRRSSLWRRVRRDRRVGRAPALTRATTVEPATITAMAVTDDRPVADQLAELGAQLALGP